jgi:hypothetical protein
MMMLLQPSSSYATLMAVSHSSVAVIAQCGMTYHDSLSSKDFVACSMAPSLAETGHDDDDDQQTMLEEEAEAEAEDAAAAVAAGRRRRPSQEV